METNSINMRGNNKAVINNGENNPRLFPLPFATSLVIVLTLFATRIPLTDNVKTRFVSRLGTAGFAPLEAHGIWAQLDIDFHASDGKTPFFGHGQAYAGGIVRVIRDLDSML